MFPALLLGLVDDQAVGGVVRAGGRRSRLCSRAQEGMQRQQHSSKPRGASETK